MPSKVENSADVKNMIQQHIIDCKKLQKESILIAGKIRDDELEESLLGMSDIMRTTPNVLRNIYSMQKEYGVESGLDAEMFAVIGSMGEEFSEVILVEDWVSLSDMLEFEYAPILERLVVALEDAQKEIA
ncbi:MAG: hypothetical protein K2M30_03155 [Desulfovibrionaceae bacterium]|nr:hypothetical protein [Desulfovibrionaceae bacterium]